MAVTPRKPRNKPTQLQTGILLAAADLSRYIYDRGDARCAAKASGASRCQLLGHGRNGQRGAADSAR